MHEVIDPGPAAGAEVIGGAESRQTLGERITPWLSAHHAAARLAGLVLGAATAIGIGLAVAATLTGPPLPGLALGEVVTGDRAGGPPPSWFLTADGQPSTPVGILVDTRLTFTDVPPGGVQVLGPAGPGIVRVTSPTGRGALVPPRAQAAPVPLGAQIDCLRVEFPVRADRYGIRVRVRDARQVTTGVLHPDRIAAALASAVRGTCDSWLVRKNLSVTAARARFRSPQPWAWLDLTVRNEGGVAAWLTSFGWNTDLLVSAADHPDRRLAPVRVPAHASTVLRLRLEARACDGATASLDPGSAATRGAAFPPSTLELLQLVADVAPPPPPQDVPGGRDGGNGDGGNGDGGNPGPIGILITPDAVGDITAALSHLCAGLRPIVVLVDRIHFDQAHRTVHLDITMDLEPPLVRSVDLTPQPGTDPTRTFRPLWTAEHGLVPDRSGQLQVRLDYRAPDDDGCPYSRFGLPEFSVSAHVPVSGGTRIVRFGATPLPTENPDAITLLCR